MAALTRAELYSLEQYAEIRDEFRRRVMAHKQNRSVQLGPNARLLFEDRLTIQYQIQEMLRAERIFETAGIQEELAAYNPLIPDGTNWKATLMIEFPDPAERQQRLKALIGVEDKVWVRVEGFDPVRAIADEDLDRETEEKTSSVHFLRFELSPEQVQAVRSGSAIAMGIDHPQYRHAADPIPSNVARSLAEDLAG
ncbi:MAG: DUF3501 family protein [Pseudomonadota bacterium]|nr:DUF3501 family protein [Pseudomonadota bacterium]